MRQEMNRANSADGLSQVVPSGDNHHVTRTVFDAAVGRALDMTAELQAIADRHFDAAPAGSLQVLQLNRAISRIVTEWIEQWSR